MAKTDKKITATTQKFTEVQDIVEEMVLFTGGNACTVLEVRATNFALLSADEQNSKIYSFGALLNSLTFPIQILSVSKRLDISQYITNLENQIKKTQNEGLSKQISLYKDFVAELVKVNSILDKKFYVVIPYSSLEKGITGASYAISSGGTDFPSVARAALRSKADSLLSQLSRIGLKASVLSKEELIGLYHDVYNGLSIEQEQTV